MAIFNCELLVYQRVSQIAPDDGFGAFKIEKQPFLSAIEQVGLPNTISATFLDIHEGPKREIKALVLAMQKVPQPPMGR